MYLDLCLDLDNVVKNLIGEVIHQADLDFGIKLTIEDDFDRWDKPIGPKLGFTSQEQYLTWAWKNEEIHWNAQPMPGAVEIIPQLYAKHHITILTATEFPDMVAPWFQKWSIPYHQIIHAKDKSQHPFDVLIDDSPTTLEKLDGMGRNVIRFVYPYNQHLLYLPSMFRWSEDIVQMFDECSYLFKGVQK